jgi:hypothetical protein
VGTRSAAGAAGVLLLVYVAAIASAWARGLRIDCGCFSHGGYDPGANGVRYATDIGRDLSLLLAAGLLVWRPASRLALARDTNLQPDQEHQ